MCSGKTVSDIYMAPYSIGMKASGMLKDSFLPKTPKIPPIPHEPPPIPEAKAKALGRPIGERESQLNASRLGLKQLMIPDTNVPQ